MARMLLPLLLVVVVAALVLVITRAPRTQLGTTAPALPARRAAAIEQARERLRVEETRYAERVRSAEQGMERARHDVEVLRTDAVVLGRCTVLVQGREHELTDRTRFDFSHEGAVAYRVEEMETDSRIVQDDRRHGRLTITGEDWTEALDVVPADFPDAQRVVAAGRAVAESVASARKERAARIERAWADLEEARAARTQVDEARLTLEDLLGAGPREGGFPEPPDDDGGEPPAAPR